MSALKAQDVMANLLNCENSDPLPDAEELNYLLYRNSEKPLDALEGPCDVDQIWTASQDKVTVQLWESRANIRIRVARDSNMNISMKGIADIAVKAIIEELRRATQ